MNVNICMCACVHIFSSLCLVCFVDFPPTESRLKKSVELYCHSLTADVDIQGDAHVHVYAIT